MSIKETAITNAEMKDIYKKIFKLQGELILVRNNYKSDWTDINNAWLEFIISSSNIYNKYLTEKEFYINDGFTKIDVDNNLLMIHFIDENKDAKNYKLKLTNQEYIEFLNIYLSDSVLEDFRNIQNLIARYLNKNNINIKQLLCIHIDDISECIYVRYLEGEK